MLDLKAAGIRDGIKTVCFTGPRPKQLFGYDEVDKYEELKQIIAMLVHDLVQQGVLTFISGGAQGFDQTAFWAVELGARDLDVCNVVYVPFKGQESRWLYTGPFSQADYRRMLDTATTVEVLHEGDNPDNVAGLLHARNHRMVDDSDFVIALLADRSLDWQHASGGTASCVRYAMSKNKPVLVFKLDADTKHITGPMWLTAEG